ncbi:MAG: hypothetical protein IJW53_05050 [Clostridia bacterium]|nr:hypothetical protein [Clostridia bacterium]
MNRTKNTIRILMCLVLILIFTVALASCEKIEQIFNKHEHTYTRVVTPPTCEEQGYTTHTCECGDSYVDGYVPVSHELVIHDAKEPTCTEVGYAEYFTCRKCSYTTYEEIAVLGHKYEEKVTRFPTTLHTGILSNICSECGDTHDEEIEAVSVTLPRVAEFIKSFVGMNEVSINAANTEIIFIDEIESEDGTAKRFIAIDLTRFELSGKEEELSARITFELGIATLDASSEETEPVFSTEMLVDIFANGDDVSVSITEGDDLESSDIDLTEAFYGYIAEQLGMTYEELAETYYLLEKVTEYLPVLESLLDWLTSVQLPEGAEGFDTVTALIYDAVVTVDDDGYYHLDVSGLIEVVEILQDKTVAEVIDYYFGKGTMVKVETFMLALPMTKVKTLAKAAETFAESNDISVDDVYALINYVVYTSTGEDFNLEHEIKIRYNKTVAEVIIELSSQGEDFTESDINAMALAMVTEIKNTLDLLNKYNVDQLYNLYTYEDASFDYSFTDEIISTLETVDGMIDASWHYSEDGTLDALEIGIGGMLSVGYDVVDGNAAVLVELTLEDGKTITLNATITETTASTVILSDEYEIVVFTAEYNELELLCAQFKLNALYIGALEGYTGEENLVNIITYSYAKGEGEDYEASFVLNLISTKEGETPEEQIGVVEKAVDMTVEFDGVNTTVYVVNGKVITVIANETDGGAEFDVTVKEGETVLADYTASIVTELDDYGMVSEASVTVVGTIEGSAVDIKAEYVNNSLSLVYKLDGAEVVNLLLAVSEDGTVTAECELDGVNVTTEIITYVKEVIEIIENLGVVEQIPAPDDLGQPLPEVNA